MDYPLTSTLKLLILSLLLSLSFSQSQAVNWPQQPQIKAGDHKLLLSTRTGPSTFPYQQPYYFQNPLQTTFTSAPRVSLSILSLKIDRTTQNIDYFVFINPASINSSYFTTTCQIRSNVTIGLLYYMYIAFARNYQHTYQYTYSYLTPTLNSTVNQSTTMIQTINQTLTNFNSTKISAFFVSFSMSANTQYSIKTQATMTDASTLAITIRSNSSLSRIQLHVIIVDVVLYQTGFKHFIDTGFTTVQNSGAFRVTTYNPTGLNYFNSIVGVVQMRIPASTAINFELTSSNTRTDSAFTIVVHDNVHWRRRQCVNTSMILFAPLQNRCYLTCSSSTLYSYGTNTVDQYCAVCSYTCASCQGDGVSCITCPSNTNRTFNNNSCRCDNGYFDQRVAVCSICIYTCLTCSGSSINCLSCVSSRTLTNTSCPCNTGFYDSGNATCLACNYLCLTCSGSATTCTSCNQTIAQRILDTQTSTCLCRSGFVSNGSQLVCITSPIICIAPCVTCINSGTSCTSCQISQNRVLSGNICICRNGYSSSSSTSTCTDTCGDGKIFQNATECDDGNTISGDGCSSTCTIQSGFTCTYNSSRPSVCISQSGYTFQSQSLIKDPSSNNIVIIIMVTPGLPSGAVPSLNNMQSLLTIKSFNSVGNIMQVNMQIMGQIPDSSTLQLAISKVSSTARVAMVASNKLQLKPYSSSYFQVYKAQSILVVVYIVLLWIIGIVAIIFDMRLFNAVVQTFVYSAVVWIGVQGQKTYSVFYQPLLKLRNVYIYNLQINNKESLFQVYNLSFLFFLLPFLLFFTFVLVGKRCRSSPIAKIKRFLLFDLTYAWLMFNGLIISYGTGLTCNYSLNPLAIGGLVFGAAYIVGTVILSYWLFWSTSASKDDINPRLQITKMNMFKPKLYPISFLSLYVAIFFYMFAKQRTTLNSLIMLGYLIIYGGAIGFGNVYINKIRYIINCISLVLIYGAILLINQISAAAWTGMVVLALVYLQLALNYTLMLFQRKGRSLLQQPSFQDSDRAKAILDQALKQQTNPVQYQNDLNQQSVQQPVAENQFSIYYPTRKKQPQSELYQGMSPQRQARSVLVTGKKQQQNFELDQLPPRINMEMNLRELLVTPHKNKQKQVEQQLIDMPIKRLDVNEI